MRSLENEDFEKNEDEKEIEKVFGEVEEAENMYSKSNIEIKNNISTIRNTDVTDCVDDDYEMEF